MRRKRWKKWAREKKFFNHIIDGASDGLLLMNFPIYLPISLSAYIHMYETKQLSQFSLQMVLVIAL